MTAFVLHPDDGDAGASGTGSPIFNWGASRPTASGYNPATDSAYPWSWAPGAVASSGTSISEANKIRSWGDGSIRNHALRLLTASSANLTSTLQVNGVDSTSTCTIAIGGTLASDTTHTVAVVNGDYLNIRLTASAADNTSRTLLICAELG